MGYCDVRVRIETWDDEPPLDLDAWDHVVDASLAVQSGLLGLEGVEGPAALEPLAVTQGTYRVRSSWAGLDGADEMDGGDHYRIQLWLAPVAEPEVRKWWAAWDPSGATARPTTAAGHVWLGAEAHDRRAHMRWLATRDGTHLFESAAGVLWESSTLPDAQGTPQLEEVDEVEAERRYGPRAEWGSTMPTRPSAVEMLRNAWRAWRYSRGWRPPADD
jgi:hypothetical protein